MGIGTDNGICETVFEHSIDLTTQFVQEKGFKTRAAWYENPLK